LLLSSKDLKPFVALMAEKKFASNISIELDDLKFVWQDKKTILVSGPTEKLYRLDGLCTAFQGKCVEK